MNQKRIGILLIVVGIIFLFGYYAFLSCCSPPEIPLATRTPTITPQPIIPTRTKISDANNTAAVPTATKVPEAIVPTVTPLPQPTAGMPKAERFGLTGASHVMHQAYGNGLPGGQYLNWDIKPGPFEIPELTFWHMITTREEGVLEDWDAVAEAIVADPGGIWIIGNEPDIAWQDNVTPEQYAAMYHQSYTFIKERDPDAQIAIAGIGQPTAMRRAYLDQILVSYETQFGAPMPIDIWTIHAFVLREERDSWGVGIPPGFTEDQGELYEIEQHGDFNILQENLRDFRAWMAARGYRDRPLAITEYGIIFPADYGFPPEVVTAFIEESFTYFATASDPETGYPADENRLVQWWFWYSVYDPGQYASSNLYDPKADQMTILGEAVEQILTDE